MAYEEVVSWRKNRFDLVEGHSGKQFVTFKNQFVVLWLTGRVLALEMFKSIFVQWKKIA